MSPLGDRAGYSLTSAEISRILWRRRALVGLALVVAVVGLVVAAYRVRSPTEIESREYRVGIGSARALIDTPKSQVVDLSDATGNGIDGLSTRAELLADLMMKSVIKDGIARRAGVAPAALIADPVRPADAIEASQAAATGRGANVLRVTVPNLKVGDSPIIAVSTRAPTPEVARRVADAAIAELRAYLSRLAVAEAVPRERQIVVTQLAPATAEELTRGSRLGIAALVAGGGFLLICALIVALTALAGALRRAGIPEPV